MALEEVGFIVLLVSLSYCAITDGAMNTETNSQDDELRAKLLRKPTLRALKRCPSKGCNELMGVRSKICRLCSVKPAPHSQSGSASASSDTLKRSLDRVVELQNAFSHKEQSKQYFSVREQSKVGTELGVVSLERTMYAAQEPPVFSVSCFVPSCVNEFRRSRENNQPSSVSCTHGEVCLKCNETSKGLTINWEFILNELLRMPEVLLMNLITTRELSKGFNYTCQPVQKLDKTSFAVFGPKSTVETHGISHVLFNPQSETYQCSCPAFLESGTTSSYRQILGELRVCFHVYMLLAAFLSDSNLRDRNKLYSLFCHAFMQDTVPVDLHASNLTVDGVEFDHTVSTLGSTGEGTDFSTVCVHLDLYICNILYHMRSALKPITSEPLNQHASISVEVPIAVFQLMEPMIAGKFGDEWKPIVPQIVSETQENGTEKTRKEWELLVAKSFNHFVSFTNKKNKDALSNFVNLEKFFMYDKDRGYIEVHNEKIQSFMHGNNLNLESQKMELDRSVESNTNPDTTGSSKTFRKLVPTYISSQVIIGRHPITSQQFPCNIQWQKSSPGFGTLQITFHYAKKVNGSFV